VKNIQTVERKNGKMFFSIILFSFLFLFVKAQIPTNLNQIAG